MNVPGGRRHLSATVPEEMAGKRLDQVLAELFPQYSRSRLQQWLREGLITVDSASLRARDKVAGGERVEVTAVVTGETPWEGEPLPLDIVYEDEALFIINKPWGMVVHPAVGNRRGTLVNALLHYAPELAGVPRAGIVHRLDKDTSGLMVVARTLEAHTYLVDRIQRRLVGREYLALVYGELVSGGRIDEPVGRHPVHRQRMAVTPTGKPAATRYRVMERFKGFTLIRAMLESGRTHQIRVHMAHLHHPVVGDPVYGRLRIPREAASALAEGLRGFKRQALHAERLALTHPVTGQPVQWQAPPPADMLGLLQRLRAAAPGE
ncbi:MAG TPA: 23S rRNA pseudouridine(1911/1915/1917) synthase RluD [Gammaproteobacteria bacterium]|nr:23S rRNA pseudouridine(1911/1915/1917) synthase RluD [Gammaproteobacteria bacterium]